MKKLTKLFIFPQLLFYIGYRIRKTIISLYVFTGCSSSIPENIDEVNIPENLTIIENSLYQIFHEIDGCLKPAEPVYQLVVNEPHPSQRYLENLYAEYLIGNERNTFQISEEYMSAVPSAVKNGEVVSVILQKLDIDYLYPKEKSKGKKLSRSIAVQVFYRILDINTGKVLAAKTTDKYYSDGISTENILKIQRA